ncbi:hypothetical protein ACO0LB_20295 [Undibacterium sp. SXout7W]|uniref:hypothetical protein n=1 Tax=Undibacterium sp. SXout7W TaxID=3413049 RepID=UPI003BF08ADF
MSLAVAVALGCAGGDADACFAAEAGADAQAGYFRLSPNKSLSADFQYPWVTPHLSVAAPTIKIPLSDFWLPTEYGTLERLLD